MADKSRFPVAVLGAAGHGEWCGISLQEGPIQLQFQLSHAFWFQWQQVGGGAGRPHAVAVPADPDYSQRCQHIGPTRPKGSVPHQLGRDLACAGAGNTAHEILATTPPLCQSLPPS